MLGDKTMYLTKVRLYGQTKIDPARNLRIENIRDAWHIIERMVMPWAYLTTTASLDQIFTKKLIFIFIFSVLACGPVQRIAMEKLPKLDKKWKYSWIEIGLGVLVFLLAISTLASNTYNPFIYFRF